VHGKPGRPEGLAQWSSAVEQTILELCDFAEMEPLIPGTGSRLRRAVDFVREHGAEFAHELDEIESQLIQSEGRSADIARFRLLTADLPIHSRTFTAATAHRAAADLLLEVGWHLAFFDYGEESAITADAADLHCAVQAIGLDRSGCERLVARMQRELALRSAASTTGSEPTTAGTMQSVPPNSEAEPPLSDHPWHSAGESPPDGFYGPLIGQKKDLGRWIVTASTAKDTGRALDNLLKRRPRDFWGRKSAERCFEVFFRDQERWAEANGCRLREEAEQPRRA
jgi:hypothetical protein